MYPYRHFRVHKQRLTYPICCFWVHLSLCFSALCFAPDTNVATKTHPNAKPPLSVVRSPLSPNHALHTFFTPLFHYKITISLYFKYLQHFNTSRILYYRVPTPTVTEKNTPFYCHFYTLPLSFSLFSVLHLHPHCTPICHPNYIFTHFSPCFRA